MKTVSLKKGLGLLAICFTLTYISFGQNYPNFNDGTLRVSSNLGIGTGNLIKKYYGYDTGEYAIFSDLQFNLKHHNFGIFTSYQSEIFQGLWNNSKFQQLTFFYGRSFNKKAFNSSINFGPSIFKLKLKSNSLNNPPKGTYMGIGLGFMGDIEYFISNRQSLGINVFANINNTKNIGGISLFFRYQIKN